MVYLYKQVEQGVWYDPQYIFIRRKFNSFQAWSKMYQQQYDLREQYEIWYGMPEQYDVYMIYCSIIWLMYESSMRYMIWCMI